MSCLFDDPSGLLVWMGGAAVVLALVWRATRNVQVGRACLAVVVAMGLVVLADALVETDREHLVAKAEMLASDLEAKRVDRAVACIDKDYKGGAGGSYDGVTKLLRNRIQSVLIDGITVKGCDVAVQGDNATMKLLVLVKPGGALKGGRLLLQSTLRWRKRADQWRILSATYPKRALPWAK